MLDFGAAASEILTIATTAHGSLRHDDSRARLTHAMERLGGPFDRLRVSG